MRSVTNTLLPSVSTAVALAFALPGCGGAPAPSASAPGERGAPRAQIPPWGFALDEMDRDVDPGDDFFRYANGGWLERFEIPPDFSNYGAFTVLVERAEAQARAILEEPSQADAPDGSPARKARDFYAAFVDVEAIEARGLDPVRADLATLAALRTHEDVARAMGRADVRAKTPFGLYVDIDAKRPDRYAIYVYQAGLGLPDRDYYLEARFADALAAYRAYVEQMLALGEVPDAAAKADAIVALERRMAAAHWPRAKQRDRDLTHNPMATVDLLTFAPGFPWRAFAESAGVLDQREVVLAEKDAIQALARIFGETPVATWSAYLQFHLLSTFAPVLPRALDDANFAFYGRTLSGQPEQRARWKRGVAAVDDALGEAVGRIYVERHFPPAAKREMEALVENVKRAFAARLERLDWMSEATKAEARAKLAGFRTKIAYPDAWKSYAGLEVIPGDAYGNAKRAAQWEWEYDRAKLGRPIDRDEWFMTPQTVNAYYSSERNEIVFPAAILQAPFFDPAADPAVNYGGIAAVIGHEIGHGFDDQGRKSDASGLLRDWWTADDAARFDERAKVLGAQYARYEPIEGMPLDPALTMGENLGDLGGLTLAYDAYRISLRGEEAPVLDGFTGDQRFFLAWAQVWKRKYRLEELRQRIVTDPHSPSEFRTNGIVRNLDAWYAAFDVTPDDALWLPPEARVSIW